MNWIQLPSATFELKLESPVGIALDGRISDPLSVVISGRPTMLNSDITWTKRFIGLICIGLAQEE